jgi:hypothetical protein
MVSMTVAILTKTKVICLQKNNGLTATIRVGIDVPLASNDYETL